MKKIVTFLKILFFQKLGEILEMSPIKTKICHKLLLEGTLKDLKNSGAEILFVRKRRNLTYLIMYQE